MKRKKNKKETLEYAKITFTFHLTKDEASEVLNNPKGQIARNMRKYMNSLLREASQRFFKPEESKENVTECKDSDK